MKKLNEASYRYSIEINVEKAKLVTDNERRLSVKSVIRNLVRANSNILVQLLTKQRGFQNRKKFQEQYNGSCHKTIWKDKNILPEIKDQIVACFGLLSILVHTWKSWTSAAELQQRIQALKMGCCRTTLSISYFDHITTQCKIPSDRKQALMSTS